MSVEFVFVSVHTVKIFGVGKIKVTLSRDKSGLYQTILCFDYTGWCKVIVYQQECFMY